MGDKLVMQSEGWAIIAKRLTAFFFALAVLNELVWRTQSSETWVYFKTFGLSGAVMLFMLFQVRVFMKYGDLEEK